MKRLILILIIAASCSEDSDNPNPIVKTEGGGIQLTNLSQNQKSYYLAYQASCDGTFKFTGDTLTVTTVVENDTLYFEEAFTDGSIGESPAYKHRIEIAEDYILLPERSNSPIFGFYGNDTLFLNKQPTVDLIQNGCRLFANGESFIGEQTGMVEEFKFGSINISNKKGVSCIPTLFRVDGYLIYDEQLSLSHIVSENGDIWGYYAISE